MTATKWVDGQRAATVVVLAVLGIGVLCLANGMRRVGETFPGFLVSENHIVLSIGRPGWSVENAEQILFAKVVAVEGRPIASATDIDAAVAQLPVGTPVSYRFRTEASVFSAVIPVTRFDLADFFALYATYLFAGACFALAGGWVLRRAKGVPGSIPFFWLCQSAGLALVTGGDVYGPYWFTPLYFTGHCLTPALLLHFTTDFPEPVGMSPPWRRLGLAILYTMALAVAVVLNRIADDPSLFLPLIYTVYLLLANAILLYVGRLVISLWTVADPALRRSVRRALSGVLLSATVPGVIFVIYPVLKTPISPVVLVAPLALFPLCTASALRLAIGPTASSLPISARRRLSLLFLGAVETAFLAGIGVFWLSNSWKQLLDDLLLNQRQQAAVERFLGAGGTAADLAVNDALVQTLPERHLVTAAATALERGDPAGAGHAMDQLGRRYGDVAEQLARRRAWLSRLDAGLVSALVVLGVVQAVAFMIAIRRWLIRPVEQLAVATNVIATGDLQHRVALDSASEFTLLAEAINTMAASLTAIQQRIEAEQEARRRTAGTARDTERRRLARELHDGTLQELSAVKLRLEGAARASGDSTLKPVVDAIIDITVGLRRIVDDLGAPDLSHASLREAIAAYAHALAEGHGVTLDLDLAGTAQVPDWATRDVYRIAQEALANAVRHGGPSHLSVALQATDGAARLQISDDGAGFDMGSVALGTGIRGMQERAAAIGAALEITTAPRHGTTVRLTLPLVPRR